MFASLIYSFILSQVFGLYMVITAILMFSRVSFYRDVIFGLKANDSSVFVGASIGLLVGLALVDTHNIWGEYPRVLVTIVCWLILIKSILWLSMSERMLSITQKLCAGRPYYVMASLMFGFGALMTSRGIIVFIQHHVMRLVSH